MEEKKISITRSFSKKVQVKQYEPCDFFCSITEELISPSKEQIDECSKKLWEYCKAEVERDSSEYINSIKKLIEGEDAPY